MTIYMENAPRGARRKRKYVGKKTVKRSAKKRHHAFGTFQYNAPPKKRKVAKRRKKPSHAQLVARKKFAAMARERAAAARQARGAASTVTNPRRTGGSMAAKKRKKRRSGTKRRRRSVVANAPRRRRRRRVTANAPRRRRKSYRRNPVGARRRRRSYRRNPVGFRAGSVVKMVTQGLKNGLYVQIGRGGSQYIANLVPFGKGNAIMQAGIAALSSIAAGMVVRKVMRSEQAAAFVVAGGFSKVIESLAQPIAGTPVIGPILTGGGMSAYPRLGRGVGLYPRLAGGMGSYDRTPAAVPSAQALGRGMGQPWGYDSPEMSDGIFT